jgi:hypothetical protein
MRPDEALVHPFVTNQRFIPKSVNLFKSKPTEVPQELVNLAKPSLVRNKYASTALIGSDTKLDQNSTKKDALKSRGSLGSLNSRLPSVTSITRLGSQISNAVGLSRTRASNPSMSKQPESDYGNALPPISYNSVYFDGTPQTKQKTKSSAGSNSFVSRLNKVFKILT